ncbi:MAG: geranylgeranylglycerol-phosphate geranylgeranyltransferase [Tenacibaculum sp.]|nr:geranylgeranylglycerol-phosphate geranylgeranyltransferase [Tenacibaculum sp.]
MDKILAKKVFSLLSVIRGYNIAVLVVALYLSSLFVFSETQSIKEILFDYKLHCLVIATVCVIAGGYIINNFYDNKIDKINRPIKSYLDNYIRQETRLSIYFLLNFLGFVSGSLVSWRASLFFATYIFGIWFYSHKLKRYPILGLISVTTLTVLPFFVIFIYYKNFSTVILMYAFFVFFLIMARELVKDLENIKGAIAGNYDTFPVVYGEKTTKFLIVFLLFLALIPIYVLFTCSGFNFMKYYFYIFAITTVFVAFYLKKSITINHYLLVHNILKILLLIWVFCLIFINKSLIFDRIIKMLSYT